MSFQLGPKHHSRNHPYFSSASDSQHTGVADLIPLTTSGGATPTIGAGTPGAFAPANYTPTIVGAITGSADSFRGHLQGIDTALGVLAGADNTLDDAYDQGGAGAGRTITVDSGAVALSNTQTSGTILDIQGGTPSLGGDLAGIVVNLAGLTKNASENIALDLRVESPTAASPHVLLRNDGATESASIYRDDDGLKVDSGAGGIMFLQVASGTNLAIRNITDGDQFEFDPKLPGQVISLKLATEVTRGAAFEAAFASATTLDGALTGVDLDFRTNVTDGGNTVKAYRAVLPAAGNTALEVLTSTTNAVMFADGDTVLGAAAMDGTEKFRVVGDVRVEGDIVAYSTEVATEATAVAIIRSVNDPTGSSPSNFGQIQAERFQDDNLSPAAIHVMFARGTEASPADVLDGDYLGNWGCHAYKTSMAGVGGIRFVADGTNTSSVPAKITIQLRSRDVGSSGTQATLWTLRHGGAIEYTPVSFRGTPGTTGSFSNRATATFTDDATAGSGTAAAFVGTAIQAPTLAAVNSTVTTTEAASLYISGPPIAGSNQTLTQPYGLWVDGFAMNRLSSVIVNNSSFTWTAASATAGADVYMRSQRGGAASTAGPAGGSWTLVAGAGRNGAGAGVGDVGGAGGAFAITAGAGGNAGTGSGLNGGAGGNITLTPGAGGAGDGVGSAGAAGQVRIGVNGSAAAPAIAFTSSGNDSGMLSSFANAVQLASDGVETLRTRLNAGDPFVTIGENYNYVLTETGTGVALLQLERNRNTVDNLAQTWYFNGQGTIGAGDYVINSFVLEYDIGGAVYRRDEEKAFGMLVRGVLRGTDQQTDITWRTNVRLGGATGGSLSEWMRWSQTSPGTITHIDDRNDSMFFRLPNAGSRTTAGVGLTGPDWTFRTGNGGPGNSSNNDGGRGGHLILLPGAGGAPAGAGATGARGHLNIGDTTATNVGIGTTSFGSGVGGLAIKNASTVPSSSPADQIIIYGKDSSLGAANATFAIRTEQGVEAVGTFTPSHKIRVWINEVEYWLQLDAV